jgi:hypothetical protein
LSRAALRSLAREIPMDLAPFLGISALFLVLAVLLFEAFTMDLGPFFSGLALFLVLAVLVRMLLFVLL